MQYELSIKIISYDSDTGKVTAERSEPVGEATLEEVHNWLTTGDRTIWKQRSPTPSAINS